SASAPAVLRAVPMSAEEKAALSALKHELGLREPLSHLAAANNIILSPHVGFEDLCAIHGLVYSRSTWQSVSHVVRRLAARDPPREQRCGACRHRRRPRRCGS
ncbi:MAG: hypothetical protein VXW25_01200, partial [Pseudomonadota bacterium]|nr:hypothetical protein [Pseudomonadota bacterium]